jgi:quercetin dioxygenase-like cupin family protein
VKMIRKGFVAILLLSSVVPVLAQDDALARSGRDGTTEYWWVDKMRGGANAYKAPNRPIWRLAELKQMHAGQNNWSQQIILDDEESVTYNSGGPGAKITRRMHPDTPTVFVIIAGNLRFSVEGQQPVTATKSGIIHIMKDTLYSADVTGDQNALWIEVNLRGYSTLYPAADPKPQSGPGNSIAEVSFVHRPEPYSLPNQLYFNTLEAIATCKVHVAVADDHLFANPALGYVNPSDNKCGGGGLNTGSGKPIKPGATFNTSNPFGHLHSGTVEWWVIQVGQTSARLENYGEYHATEGDVMYVPPNTWHETTADTPSGPSVRLAMGSYQRISMQNTGPAR